MLKESAHSKRLADRQEAAEILGAAPSEPGTQLLMGLLDDRHLRVRIKAIESLGKVRAAAALPYLHKNIADPNIGIRTAAAAAPAEIASPRAMDEILIHIEVTGGADELAELKAFYPQVKGEEGPEDRVEWTSQRLEWEGL